jgi:hypothetical protein
MKKVEYNPLGFSQAMGAFKKHLGQVSPQTLEVLSDPEIGLSYTVEGFVFFFPTEHRDIFDRITMAPSLVVLKGAAQAAGFDIKLRSGNDEVLVERA